MGEISKQGPAVKLIVGFIFYDAAVLPKAEVILKRRFGNMDFQSPLLDFTHTDYYHEEFGASLKRKFISFAKLIPPDALPKIKIYTNKIERKFLAAGKRLINIDPGYLDLAKLVLASTKDFVHRIYLDKNIFAETTLFYQNKTFRPWECTYPDYRSPEYIEIFNQIREIYAEQIRNNRKNP